MSRNLIIAIDGPAASGKSSAGRLLAERLGIIFFDTGIMYRVITLAALWANADFDDEFVINQIVNDAHIEIKRPSINDGRINDIFLNGEDVTLFIRSKDVNQHVSKISSYKSVRDSLTQQQREIANTGDMVMVGRDIGTVVLPNADFKFYLEASVDVRAKRRLKEFSEDEKIIDLKEIKDSLLRRDEIDSNRKIAPLRPAEDAINIQTDDKSLDQVVDEMLGLIDSKLLKKQKFGP